MKFNKSNIIICQLLKFLAATVVLTTIASSTSWAAGDGSISKAHYQELNSSRLLKIANSLASDKHYKDANKILYELASRPDPRMQLEVAKIRSRRLDELQNTKLAQHILENLLAGKSLVRDKAAFELARLYKLFPKFNQQHRVPELLKQSAQLGNKKAHAELGFIYLNGIGVERNLPESLIHYRRAALFYSTAPIMAFARHVQDVPIQDRCGISPSQIASEFYEKLVKEASGGYAAAAKELARLHLDGQLVQRSFTKSRNWLRVAVINGDIGAMRDLALLELVHDPQSKTVNRSIEMLKQAAAAGNSAALTALGRLEKKLDRPLGDKQARGYFERAIDAGHAAAIVERAREIAKHDSSEQQLAAYRSLRYKAKLLGKNIPKLQNFSIARLRQPLDFANIDTTVTGSVTQENRSPSVCKPAGTIEIFN